MDRTRNTRMDIRMNSLKSIKITPNMVKQLGFIKDQDYYVYKGDSSLFIEPEHFGKVSLYQIIQEIIEYEREDSKIAIQRQIKEMLGIYEPAERGYYI